ncbi:MAG: 2-hydroxyacid dehydrogenase [Burkholderiales bacterium]|nr:2-hydroxyacid dehydrogenase [Burkholderiales bacterium]
MPPELINIAPLPAFIKAPLAERFVLHDLYGAGSREARAALIAQVGPRIRGMVAFGGSKVTPEQLEALPALEIISVFGVGYDGIPVEYCASRGIKVTHTPGVLDDEVADTAVALILMTLRRLVAAHKFIERGDWLKGQFPLTRTLVGKRVGLVGLGRIGRAIAERLVAHKAQIAYHARTPKPVAWPYYGSVLELARHSDVLVVATPGGAATRHLIDASVLEALGPEGVLVNIARGSVVDEAALVAALEAGRIAGAGLDVFEDEPRVPEALFHRDNVVLLPHVGSATEETRAAMGRLCVENLCLHFDGRPVATLVPELVGRVLP